MFAMSSAAPSHRYDLRPRKRSRSEVERTDIQPATDSLELSSARAKSENQAVAITPSQEVPFQILANTQPPILGKSTSMPSFPFVEKLVQALDCVPRRLRQSVSDWGYKIVTAISLPAVLPEPSASINVQDYLNKPISVAQFNRIAHKLSAKTLWATNPSGFTPFPKTILAPEWPSVCVGVLPDGNGQLRMLSPYSRGSGEVVLQDLLLLSTENNVPGEFLLHELGHAVDDYLGKHPDGNGFLSSSSTFSQAYWDDVGAITDPQQRNQFAYLLPRADNPTDVNGEAKKEAFSELFSRILVSDGNPEEHTHYQTSFPKVSAFIKQVVLTPWMSEEEPEMPLSPQEELDQTKMLWKYLLDAEGSRPGSPVASKAASSADSIASTTQREL